MEAEVEYAGISSLVRGVGFEPTKAYATGYLLSRILSQAHLSSLLYRRGMSCPFGLIPAHEIGLQLHYYSMGLGNPRAPSKNLNNQSALKKRRIGLSSNCD